MRRILLRWLSLGLALGSAGLWICAEPAKRPRLDRNQPLQFRDASGEARPVANWSDWLARRAEIRRDMESVMGPLPGPEKRCHLDPHILETVDCGEYLRHFLTYRAEPGGRVPAYMLVPKLVLAGGIQAPAILALHQTHPAGHKVVVGLGNSPHDEYGVELAKRGFVVLAPAYPLLADYAPDLKRLGYASGTMKAIWDNIRGIDLLESQPFVSPGKIGAIGHSLGGHNSLYTAAFEDRVKVVVSSCGFDSFLEYMDGNVKGWTSVRYMPRLLDYALEEIPFDFHEVLSLIAPRPIYVNAPLGDSNFRWRSVDRVGMAAGRVYEFLGATGGLTITHPDVGHSFPPAQREAAYAVIENALKP